jgi:fructuronate reductase
MVMRDKTNSSPRLSLNALGSLPADVIRPRYDRAATQIGIVHFGPGVFHRAHQAFYLDRILGSDPRWAIAGVNLHSAGVREALEPQDFLYTIAELDAEPRLRIVGSLRDVLAARDTPDTVFAHLTNPSTRLLTLTITENGYCLNGGKDLDTERADIQHDLRDPSHPTTAIGWIVEALKRRRANRTPAFGVISCDNLPGNGRVLKHAVVQFADMIAPDLARWIEAEVLFPSTMVDSIAPATDAALKARIADALGVWDEAPVQRERFTQWVIEDLGGDGPDWREAGVIISRDVDAYDRAKLRLLNGAHSTLAYLGLALGYRTVAEAMRDDDLAGFVRTMMRRDIAPTLDSRSGIDIPDYIESILTRFRNPAIHHLLSQIALDGSRKLPYRILEPVAERIAAGHDIARYCLPIAAWMLFVRRAARDDVIIGDPLSADLTKIGKACSGNAPRDVDLFLSLAAVFPQALAADARFQRPLKDAYRLLDIDVHAALATTGA